ncbi:MAG: TonB-dependent receptor [Gemmatimonadales bacterium]
MRRFLGLTIAVAGAVLLSAGSAAAQAGSLQGKVTDSTGAAIAGASIRVEGTVLRATSSGGGAYSIRGLRAATYKVSVRAIGFTPTADEVTVGPGQAVEHDFSLARTAVELAPIDVVIGSRGRHTTAEELAVPVDVYNTEQLGQQGTTETGQILAALSPSINFPHQSVTDANDIVRPFTLRGLSPDHSLVLINGWRRHQTALVNTFPYGSGAGSSGVDLNAIPAGAIDRVEVLRDGASAQYGSDAIAGVVNLVMKEGRFDPFLNTEAGRYATRDYPADGTSVDVNGGVGFAIGRGSLALFGEYQNREPTNRAYPDIFLADANGITDDIDTLTGTILKKNNSLKQPELHWGDGLEKDQMTFANFRMPLNQSGSSEFYAFGGYSHRVGTGNGFWRYLDSQRNWREIYPQGFLPEFRPNVNDYSGTGGFRTSFSGWSLDLGGSFGLNRFDYRLRNTLNSSLGPCLDVPCAPGADGILGNQDDPGIPNQTTFFAGRLRRTEYLSGINLSKAVQLGLPAPVNFAVGATFRHEVYQISAGETASWINGGHLAQDSSANELAPAGSSVFGGFSPNDASKHGRNNFGTYVDLESNLSTQLLANVAGRYEHYSDFGSRVTGKLALRLQPSRRLVLRGAASTGFRAPGLSQNFFSHTTTNFIGGQLLEIGNFPVDHPASKIFGAKPLKDETSVNLSGGLAISPTENFTLTLDYFHIKINDRILLGASFADTVAQRILSDSGFPQISGVQFFTNGLDTKTDGVDVTADWRVPAGAAGTLDFTVSANYTRNKISKVDPLPAILQGTATGLTSILDLVTQLGIEKERPDWRGTLTAQYANGRFHSLGRVAYYGKFASAQPSFTDEDQFGAKTLVDAEIGYRFNQVNLSVGARNLFDTYPDKAKAEFNNNDNTFPWAAASPFGYNGRYIYTRLEATLGF